MTQRKTPQSDQMRTVEMEQRERIVCSEGQRFQEAVRLQKVVLVEFAGAEVNEADALGFQIG